MGRARKSLIMAGAVGLVAIMFGFVVFATSASRRTSDSAVTQPGPTDGIVVLTGGERRIEEGVRLLGAGYGRRLLISGINPKTKRQDLRRFLGSNGQLFECCIDFGYEAQDTIGNADEARAWASHHKFARVIVVTSSYHMPRSLAELARVLPETELVAHPVVPRWLGEEVWWLHLATTKVLVGEYLKLLPSAVRYGAARLWRPLDAHVHLVGQRAVEPAGALSFGRATLVGRSAAGPSGSDRSAP